MNHYATSQFFNKGGRHYWFAENLLKNEYEPVVFCANTLHNTEADFVDVGTKNYIVKEADNIPFVFVKAKPYKGNGPNRIFNILTFYRNMFKVAKQYAKKHGKPDVIYASSVHPLTLVAGIKIAKKFGVPCICEVRDLWPESMVAYGVIGKNNVLTKLLYQGEKWIYKKANSLIMTWEGGKDYIIEQGWDKELDIHKVNHINNGVVIDSFDKNSEEFQVVDEDLDNTSFKNIVYTGSIRKVNNLGMLLDAAKVIQQKGLDDIRFLIYGAGNERDVLEQRCVDEGINNLIFKGRVEKQYVPSILKKSYINILHNSSTSLDKYGQSQNKLFEYLAAGKCIVQTYTTGYSVCDTYDCGISAPIQNAEEIANAIILACNEETNARMGMNARAAAYEFDFKKLTNKLIHIIENVEKG